MKTIDEERDCSGIEIARIIEANASVTIKNVRVVGDLDVSYETHIDELVFVHVHFLGRVDIGGHKGKIVFENAIFDKEVDLYLSHPRELNFENCEFLSRANFHSIETSSLWLNGSRFKDHCVFVNMKVEELLNLADVVFEKSVDFSGAKLGEMNSIRLRSDAPIQILWSQFGRVWLDEFYSWASVEEGDERRSRLQQLEAALQFWKRNFASLGQKRDELEANYELVRLRKNHLIRKYSLGWWASTFLELPSRFGTRPFRPLILGIALILLFGCIYWLTDPFQSMVAQPLDKEPLWIFAILYSVDTFVPFVHITGVGDWGWVVSNQYRWLVVAERALGLATSVLAAYSISQNLPLTEE
jgi:hypothetical protein